MATKRNKKGLACLRHLPTPLDVNGATACWGRHRRSLIAQALFSANGEMHQGRTTYGLKKPAAQRPLVLQAGRATEIVGDAAPTQLKVFKFTKLI